MTFEGKYALVTGTSSGIGRETARLLAQRGANVACVDVVPAGLESLREELKQYGHEVLTYECNVADYDRVNEVAADLLAKWGRLDILINNAGIWRCDGGPFAKSTPEMWKKKIDVNCYGVLYFCRAFINPMIEQRSGVIINVASVAGMYGIANLADYSLTKGGVIAFSKALAREVAAYGVRVNSMSPGNVTPIDDPDNPGYKPLSYMDRGGRPIECAELLCFMASDEASWLDGENYVADGCRRKI